MDDQGVRRAAGLLGIGGVLLILRLPWLGLLGWVAGSVVVVLGALSMRRARTARRWSAAFVSQLAVWVPLAVHVAASTARDDSVSVEGAAAVGVFALAVVPLGVLLWSAAASQDEQVATVVAG